MKDAVAIFQSDLFQAFSCYVDDLEDAFSTHTTKGDFKEQLLACWSKDNKLQLSELLQSLDTFKKDNQDLLSIGIYEVYSLGEVMDFIVDMARLSDSLMHQVMPLFEQQQDLKRQVDAISMVCRGLLYPQSRLKQPVKRLLKNVAMHVDKHGDAGNTETHHDFDDGVKALVVRYFVQQLTTALKQHIDKFDDKSQRAFIDSLCLPDGWLRLVSAVNVDERLTTLKEINASLADKIWAVDINNAIAQLLHVMVTELLPSARYIKQLVPTDNEKHLMINQHSPYVIDPIALDDILSQDHAHLTMGVFLIGKAANEDVIA